MGRAHLSTKYGIDDLPVRKSPFPEPPRFVDAPFDIDAETDAPDAVYETFVDTPPNHSRPMGEPNPHEPILDRNTTPSPSFSVESDDDVSDATTQPSTRVPSPHPVDQGSRVMELLEPLWNARQAAIPGIQAALDDGIIEVRPLVLRLCSILRPHINSSLAPFVSEIPEVEVLGQMFERSLVIDILSNPGSTVSFDPSEILVALDAAEEVISAQGSLNENETEGTDSASGWWRSNETPARRWANTRAPQIMTPRPRATTPFLSGSDYDDSASSSSGPGSRVPSPQFIPRIFRASDPTSSSVNRNVGEQPFDRSFITVPQYVNPAPLR